jgi:CubicO group peptidase (beta-lactamase class C family)
MRLSGSARPGGDAYDQGMALTRITVAALLLAVSAACSDDTSDSSADAEQDEVPEENQADQDAAAGGTEWEVAAPAEHDMDETELESALDYAFTEGRNTQGVVVVRDGVIVAERYDDRADETSWATSWSVAKSVTSALVGIALEEGLIPSVDEPMTTYYPDWEGTPREDITVRHVLQMASGLDFEESYDADDLESSDIIQMVLFQEDQLAYAADRPDLHEPGTVFNYSSGDTQLLSGLLEQVTGMQVSEYAAEKLFDPIGFDQVEWWEDANEHTLTYCCLDTTTRNFARFGQLYLNGGEWDGEAVVPEAWVEESVEESDASDGYGYQWWLTGNEEADLPGDTFSDRGHDGQFIYVVPSLDLVVVRNGTYIKHDGEPVADPNLYTKLPNSLVTDLGTIAPDQDLGWDDTEFLGPIVASVDT